MEYQGVEPSSRQTDARRASLAAFLSFLFPGLGQAYNGRWGLAWLLAAPILLLVGVAVIVIVMDASEVLARLFDIRFLVGLVVLDLVLFGWRLIAVLQAHSHWERPSGRSTATRVTAVMVLLIVAMHALPAYYLAKAIDTLDTVALGGSGGADLDDPFQVFSGLPEPSGQPDVTGGDRVNILLVGLDSLPSRSTRLTDTMLVVSLDPDGTRSAMISIPRDLYGVPLPGGRLYNNKLNSLMTYAAARPGEFPLGGVGTLKAAIGNLLGVPIHYFAAIDLLGFKKTVDAIGGVDITVQRAVNDPTYADEFDKQTGFFLKAGTYHMNGHTALAFVRSRKGSGDSDFTRADRQQQLLEAIRDKLTAGNLLVALPDLLDAVKATIRTDVPGDRIAELANAVQQTDVSQLERIVLQPPDYMTVDAHSSAGYILHPNLRAIRAIGDALIRGVPLPSGSPSPSP